MAGANPEALGTLVPIQAGSPSAPVAPGVTIGDVLYWNGAVWIPLPPGLDGEQLTTHGVGLAPTWEPGSATPIVPGVVIGDVLYWDGLTWQRLPPGVLGEQLTTQGAGLAPVWAAGTAATPLLGFGANNVAATTTTRYLFPWHSDNQGETAPTQYRFTRAGTLRNFRLRHNAPAGNGNDIVYTVRINNAATALVITLASTGTDGSDLVNSVVVAAGDLIDVEVTKALGIGASPINIESSLEFAA